MLFFSKKKQQINNLRFFVKDKFLFYLKKNERLEIKNSPR